MKIIIVIIIVIYLIQPWNYSQSQYWLIAYKSMMLLNICKWERIKLIKLMGE